MWIDKLRLKNFRGFKKVELDLSRQLTVLIGKNGAGKSSVVDALEMLAHHAWEAASQRSKQYAAPSADDVHIGERRCHLELLLGTKSFSVVRSDDSIPPSANDVKEESVRARPPGPIQTKPSHIEPEDCPLVLLFKTERALLLSLSAHKATTHVNATIRTPRPAWDDLQGGHTSFEFSEFWFRETEDLENQRRVRDRNLDYNDPGLEAVRTIIKAAMPGFSDPRIDRQRPLGRGRSQLVLTKDGQEYCATMLSDGERSVLVLILEIARRLAFLQTETPVLDREATIVIDEIELHLHPAWQRTLLSRLMAAFPKCQFIVTTHSPQVISSASQESMIVLDNFQVYEATVPTHGRDSNAILEELMDVAPRPEDFMLRLREASTLVDDGDLDEAQIAVAKLEQEWGEDDREVVRLRTALQFREL